jgi:hypothetical protein
MKPRISGAAQKNDVIKLELSNNTGFVISTYDKFRLDKQAVEGLDSASSSFIIEFSIFFKV